MTSLADYNAARAAIMTEAQLQGVITALATRTGWLVYHTHDSRRSQPGYPDLHLVHPDLHLVHPDLHLVHPETGRSLFRELKTEKGKLRPDQATWIAALTAASQDVAIWRPSDWMNNSIYNTLAL